MVQTVPALIAEESLNEVVGGLSFRNKLLIGIGIAATVCLTIAGTVAAIRYAKSRNYRPLSDRTNRTEEQAPSPLTLTRAGEREENHKVVSPGKISTTQQFADFLRSGDISSAQVEASKITKPLLEEHCAASQYDLVRCTLKDISSDRYHIGAVPTELEKHLDTAVQHGDLPITPVSLDLVNEAARGVGRPSEAHPKFYVVQGQDALTLDETAKDLSVVQVASQFNGLESTTTDPASVLFWIDDRTQGPRASLQSIAGAKHREAAHLKGQLPDAIHGVLDGFTLSNGQRILDAHPELYRAGYLELFRLTDDHLLELQDHLHRNLGSLNFLSQFVLCEQTGKRQLQVFCAAPSFQDDYTNWDVENTRTNALKSICTDLVSAQYRATAQAAAISGQDLHLTLVGQGAFRNPPQVVGSCLREVRQQLEGTNVQVYLHGWGADDCNKWTNAALTTNCCTLIL